MLRSPKLATPLTAATGVVPLSVALPGLLPSATATAPVNPVARFPKASSARTFTAGVIGRFATVVPGSVPNTSWVATPAVILKLLLVAVFRPVAVGQYTVLVLVWPDSTNVGTPLPPYTPALPISTAPVNPVARFPKASSARTFTAGLIWWFATVVLGCVPNTSWVAAPGVTLKPLLVAGVRPVAVALST